MFFVLYILFFYGFGYYGIICFIRKLDLNRKLINTILILLVVVPWFVHHNGLFKSIKHYAPSEVTYDADKFSNAFTMPIIVSIVLIVLIFYFSLKKNWVVLLLPVLLCLVTGLITMQMIWGALTITETWWIADFRKKNFVYFLSNVACTFAFAEYCMDSIENKIT